jgi:putative NIF3 family GTP cyclohydrolase 1 type 2
MTLSEFYRAIIEEGRKTDLRSAEIIDDELLRWQDKFDKLDDADKALFDADKLFNPYADTRLLQGTGDEELTSLMIGIDIDAGEIAVADRLRQKGQTVDLVVSHHPSSHAWANLHDVMRMQVDIIHQLGVPIAAAEDLMDGRIKQVERRLLPANHTRAADAAALLDIPLLCVHTPADNHVTAYLQEILDKEQPKRLSHILDLLLVEPEYQDATRRGVGPRIVLGNKDRRTGKVFVDMTGGTSGAKDVFEKLANGGVDTIVGMHISDDYRKEAKKHHLNVIIAGHISSDTIGMNLLLDSLEKRQGSPFMVHNCSGFKRHSRTIN